jgi:hypothetical protein
MKTSVILSNPIAALAASLVLLTAVPANADPLRASFQRDLDRTTAPVTFYHTPAADTDPLQALVNVALWNAEAEKQTIVHLPTGMTKDCSLVAN